MFLSQIKTRISVRRSYLITAIWVRSSFVQSPQFYFFVAGYSPELVEGFKFMVSEVEPSRRSPIFIGKNLDRSFFC